MSILKQATMSRKNRPQRVVLYSPEGLGKTTFAGSFPNVILLDTEQGGADHLDGVAKINISTWQDLLRAVAEVTKGGHGYDTVAVDTLDWAEKLCEAFILERDDQPGIEEYGYGKGYTALREEFQRLLNGLSICVTKGITVVCTGHSQIKRLELPEHSGQFDRYELKMSKQVSPIVKEWADILLFGNWEMEIAKDNVRDKKGRAIGGKRRVIHSVHSAAWDAKCRHGLPETFPLDSAPVIAVACVAPDSEPVNTGQAPAARSMPTEPEPDPEPVNTGQAPAPAPDPQEEPGEWDSPLADLFPPSLWFDLKAFLVDRQVIGEGMGLDDIPEGYVNRAMANQQKFMATFSDWRKARLDYSNRK